MKKFALFVLSVSFIGPISAGQIDPIYELFDDESDSMVITQPPLELDSVSLGFDASSDRRLEEILNPPQINKDLSSLVDRLTINELQIPDSLDDSARNLAVPVSTFASTAPELLLQRARLFEKAKLIPLAREEYSYLLQLHAGQKDAQHGLSKLLSQEINGHLTDAHSAQKAGEFETALFHVNQVLALTPQQSEASDLKRSLLHEQKIKSQMSARVTDDLNRGVELYRNSQMDLALANFVKVLNFDPNNQVARSYIQKIGQQLKVENRD